MSKQHYIRYTLLSLMSLMLMTLCVMAISYLYLESQLPDVDTLKDVRLQVPLRVYSADGKLINEFGEKRRTPVTLDQVPQQLIQAVLATEDQRFYEHPGVDFLGLLRAAVQLARTGTKSEGGSTITMQVARNFFLTRKKSYTRKVNEILLAIKIDQELEKNKILELYLNKIYFGNRAYGVATAAEVYYGKALSQLSLAQLAMIAGLPKAPSTLNPIADPSAAKARRHHVLERMLHEDYLTEDEFQAANKAPLTASYHGHKILLNAPYVAEMVRQALFDRFGKGAYTNGYAVYTTIDSHLQEAANHALENGLRDYDRRHGFRGPLDNYGDPLVADLQHWLEKLSTVPTLGDTQAAAVIHVHEQSINCILKDGQIIEINWPGLSWARMQLEKNRRSRAPQVASEIVQAGDVIFVAENAAKEWELTQIPNVDGALVSISPNDGAIKAMVGGFSFYKSNFNRVTQAERQAGSNFKPFIYAAALDKGLTLAHVINDAPVVLDDPSLESLWRPQNDTRRFYGPTRLRIGLTRSRNIVSIRLLESIGVNYAVEYLARFGFDPHTLPRALSLALGSANVTPLQMAAAYATLANNGHRIDPYIIAQITGARSQVLYQASPKVVCDQCEDTVENKQHLAQRVLSPQTSYLLNSALQDVIKTGTGRGAKVLKRTDLAGKTGTTNKQMDAWFSGFTPDIVTTVWVGFDRPQSLYEYGAKAALPIWINYMRTALADLPNRPYEQPAGIVSVRIDPTTGVRAYPGQKKSIFEYFREEYAPAEPNPAAAHDYRQSQPEDIEHLF